MTEKRRGVSLFGNVIQEDRSVLHASSTSSSDGPLSACVNDRGRTYPCSDAPAPVGTGSGKPASTAKPLSTRHLASLLFLLTFGLALRICWIAAVPNVQVADFKTYDAMASSFYRGTGYVDAQGRASAFKPPGYPLLLALVYRIFGESRFAAKVIQANLSTLICLLVFLLARRLFGLRPAFIALTLSVMHPTLIYSTSLLGTEIPYTCLTTAAVLVLILHAGEERLPVKAVLLSGLAFGFAGLMRPMALLSPLAIAAWLLVERRSAAETTRVLVVFCLALAVPVLPWTIRNYTVFHRLVPVSTNGGFNLFYGHNPMGEVVWIPYERLKCLPDFPSDDEWAAMDEPSRSAYLSSRAWEYIRMDPAGVLRRMPVKFYLLFLSPDVPSLYWNLQGLPPGKSPSGRIESLLALFNRAFSYTILLFAAIGLARTCGRGDRRIALPVALLIVWTIFHLFYWGKPRFRFPFIPILVLLAAEPMAGASAAVRVMLGLGGRGVARV